MRYPMFAGLILIGAILGGASASSLAQTKFVAPPRTITDITAILDAEKPDSAKLAQLISSAEANLPNAISAADLAHFYSNRALNHIQLGNINRAVADGKRALELGRTGLLASGEVGLFSEQLMAIYDWGGLYREALSLAQESESLFDRSGTQGRLFNVYRQIARFSLELGDVTQAEAYLRKAQALLTQSRNWPVFRDYGPSFSAQVERTKASLFLFRGQSAEAEESLGKAIPVMRNLLEQKNVPSRFPDFWQSTGLDKSIAAWGIAKAKQGRLAEAEADIRGALLSRLRATGKYNVTTLGLVIRLADILVDAGRYVESETLLRRVLETLDEMKLTKASQFYAEALAALVKVLDAGNQRQAAQAAFEKLEEAVREWDLSRRESILMNSRQAAVDYNAGNLDTNIMAAKRLYDWRLQRLGDQNPQTAVAQAWYAIGLARAGRLEDARKGFEVSIPILLDDSRGGDDGDGGETADRDRRLLEIVENYLVILASSTDSETASQTLRLSEAIRGRSVQRALAASSARATAGNPAAADMLRRSQDLEKQVNAQLGALNNLLARSPAERDEALVTALRKQIDILIDARNASRKEVGTKVRGYDNLVNPDAPTVAEMQKLLGPDEAFLSLYFGQHASFVWAVPKQGTIRFAMLNTDLGQMERKIGELRRSLEQNVASIAEIEPYNLKIAYELYETLLKPVEAGWKPARQIIMVTNGALGLLPLGLLPTEPSEVQLNQAPLFSAYKHVAWLARTHAVTMIPSGSALRTLRELQKSPVGREQLIGFGDPIFSSDQSEPIVDSEDLFSREATMRGLPFKRRAVVQTRGLDSADISMLPRLPDTADELVAIAKALGADSEKSLHLGKSASEKAVLSADLSKYKIVAFATHGLVSGDLDGLYQPALALSSPKVTGDAGDGLLTMDKILGLRLNADWVVLSACNTAAGVTAGAEANSGLGRAFFYAGTRALLVTNWSVHSASARELVSDLFRKQQENPKLSRAEALQQSMIALLDGKGFTDENGQTAFSYAHPLFWAPYSIIGDGRAAQ